MMSCISTPGPSTHSSGHIQVIFGPMFSGKTTELMRRMKRYQLANYSCMIIKYINDQRYDAQNLSTHDKQTIKATPAAKLLDVEVDALKSDVIGVDEGQFFPDVVTFCEKMADQGKTVIVAALDGTFQREGFGDILKLVPLAESVIKLTAVCMRCYGEASFTKRKGHETELEVIGGADKYLATCRACHKSPRKVKPLCSPRQKTSAILPSSPTKPVRRLFGSEIDANVMDIEQD